MANQIIEDYRIITTSQLIRAIKDGKMNSERFCFIIGAGASESSGIPTGRSLERIWMDEMENSPGLEEIREVAIKLKNNGHLEHDFSEIMAMWDDVKKRNGQVSSEFYFDIYKLRFFPNHRNGYHYLENIMAGKSPSFGYRVMALMLADGVNNLVITTNFDNLIEDALFLYTDRRPLVINHELLAEFAGDPNIKRPIIAKVHRGIFFEPLNKPEETNELKGKWHDILSYVFQCYTPIVIGYGGGDKSLMNLLEEKTIKMKNGIYWCYKEEYGLPSKNIQKLVEEKKGYLVRTAGFDATMLAIGNAFFQDKIGTHETEQYLLDQTNKRIVNYDKEYRRLINYEEDDSRVDITKDDIQSEEEFRKELEKLFKRDEFEENKRRESKQMTVWDYRRDGNKYYDSNDFDRAVESYSKAIKLQPNTSVFYNDRGCAYDYLKKYDKALLDFDKAIELNNDFEEAYSNRGHTYDCLKEYDKALSDYSKAIELNPEYEEAYNNRGCTYDSLKEYDKALSDYSKAIELNPENVEAYNNRGVTYLRLKEFEEAVFNFNKAIELKPDFANPYKYLGTVWFEQENPQMAIEYFTKAIELDPKYKEAYLERAKTYRIMNEIEKAIDDENIASKLS